MDGVYGNVMYIITFGLDGVGGYLEHDHDIELTVHLNWKMVLT